MASLSTKQTEIINKCIKKIDGDTLDWTIPPSILKMSIMLLQDLKVHGIEISRQEACNRVIAYQNRQCSIINKALRKIYKKGQKRRR